MMFGFTLTAVFGALLFGSTECTITSWTTAEGTTNMASVTHTSCASVAEDGTVAFTVTATTDAAPLAYSIQTQPTGTTGTYMFAVGSTNGVVILTTGTLNHESDASMVFVIRATDSTTGGAETGDLTCILTVTDVNEAAPAFSLTGGCLNFPSLVATSLVWTVDASDADTSQTVTYAIASGNTGNVLTYDSSTGALEVGSTALTATSSYPLVLTGTDNGSPAMTSTVSLTVNIMKSCTCGAVVMAISTLALISSLLAFLG